MSKSFLIEKLTTDLGMTRAQANRALLIVEGCTAASLEVTGKATIPGIGTLRIEQREPREGRNPRTGAKIKIAARKAVSFSASSGLKSHAQKCKVAA